MIPALFVFGGLCISGGIFVYAWKVTATEDTTAVVDAEGVEPCRCAGCLEDDRDDCDDEPVPYVPVPPEDHPGWPRLHAAVYGDDFEQHVADALDVANLFTQADIDRLRAVAAADAAGVQW